MMSYHVWSYDPDADRWWVVDTPDLDTRAQALAEAERRNMLAKKYQVEGAYYVGLPEGEEPTDAHRGLGES